MFTDEESGADMVVPLKPSPAMVTLPDPLALIFISSLVCNTSMLLSLNLMLGNSTVPVPDGCTSMSALDSLDVMLLSKNLISDFTDALANSSVKLLFILLPAS